MPSVLIGNPLASGPQQLISGNYWSGRKDLTGEVVLKLDKTSSGRVYVGLSGGTTMTSGGVFLSGSLGNLDGVCLDPGDFYRIPRIAFQQSGNFNIYVRHDAACSGQARVYWEVF